MPKPGIKILTDTPGEGPAFHPGEPVRIRFVTRLRRGEALGPEQILDWVFGKRNVIAGFRYGLEGMRPGGVRVFQAKPHLCYREATADGIPPTATLIFEIREIRRLP